MSNQFTWKPFSQQGNKHAANSTPLLSSSPYQGAYSPGLAPSFSQSQSTYLPPQPHSPAYFPTDQEVNPSTGYIPFKHETPLRQADQHTSERRKIEKSQRRLGKFTIISTIVTFLLSAVMSAAMLYVIITFLRTKDTRDPAGSNLTPWPPEQEEGGEGTKTWPTYVLLGAAIASFIIACLSLLAEFCRPRKRTIALKIVYNVLHVIVWIVVAIVYRTERGANDLWGWSCNMRGGNRERIFSSVLSFSILCQVQNATWASAIAEAAIKLLFVIFGWIVSRTLSKRMGRLVAASGGAVAGVVDSL